MTIVLSRTKVIQKTWFPHKSETSIKKNISDTLY